MKLRTKVILSILFTWFIIIGGTYFGVLLVLKNHYRFLEQKRIHNNLTLINEIINNLKANNTATNSGAHATDTIQQNQDEVTAIIKTYLTDGMLYRLKKDTQLNLLIYPLTIIDNDPQMKQIYPMLLTHEYYKVDVNENVVNVYTLLRNASKKPLAIMQITDMRYAHLLELKTLQFFNIAFILIGIIFSLILFYQLKVILINRLISIKDTIKQITLTKNYSLQINDKSADEITAFVKKTNQMLTIIYDANLLLNNIIDFMPSIIVIVDSEFKVTHLNQLALQECGIYRNEAFYYSLFELMPFLKNYQSIFERSLKEKNIEKINKISTENESNPQYYEALIYPLQHSMENQLVIRLDNLTKHLEIEAAIIEQERLSAIGVLTAGVAHEINNPINFITSSFNPLKHDLDILQNFWLKYHALQNADAETLESELQKIERLKKEMDFQYTSEEILQLLESMTEGITRTSEITRDLKFFATSESVLFEKVNIEKGIEATLGLLKPNYQNNITILKYYGNIPEIDGVYGKLNQAWMNLLTNAVDAILPKQGIITITTLHENNYVRISIKDDGIGINTKIIKKIFDPFFTTKEVGKGTGLGLSIAFSIIRDHGGSIDVMSEPNKGTEFIITLPITKAVQ
jgi:signal transduction histidine kinase